MKKKSCGFKEKDLCLGLHVFVLLKEPGLTSWVQYSPPNPLSSPTTLVFGEGSP